MFEKVDPRDTRRENLRYLVEKFGQAEVARRTGKPDRQIGDILAKRKSFGEKVARDMEESWRKFTGEALDLSYPGMVPDLGLGRINEKAAFEYDSDSGLTSDDMHILNLYWTRDAAQQAIIDIILYGANMVPKWMSPNTVKHLELVIEAAREQSPDTTKKSDQPSEQKAG